MQRLIAVKNERKSQLSQKLILIESIINNKESVTLNISYAIIRNTNRCRIKAKGIYNDLLPFNLC